MAGISHRVRRHGYRLKQRFREDPFSTIILYSILLGLFFLAFSFRGMLLTMFVKPIGIVNPALEQISQPTPAEESTTDESQLDAPNDEDAVTFRSSGTYVVKSGDTLSSVADSLNLDWKELAELNKVEPPYALKVGQELKLP